MTDRMDFFKRSEAMMAFYGEGKYLDALNVTEQLAVEFPDETATTSFWRVCLLSRAGRTDDALRAMSKALEQGLWWSEGQLRADEDLASLQGLPDFERMVTECRTRHAAAQRDSKPDVLVRLPEGEPPYPLLIALHARGGSPERDIRNWMPVLQMGWMLAMPQSSQLGSPNSYVWDDMQTARTEVIALVQKLLEEHPIDKARVILAGLSQGGALAIQMCLSNLLPACGFLSVAPGRIAVETLEELIPSARGKRGYLVVGGRDYRYEMTTQMHASLNQHGIPCELENHPEMGHAFPKDFDATLTKALRFLTL